VVGIVPRLNSGSWRTVREMSRSGSGKELLAWAGIDADHIAASARRLLGKSLFVCRALAEKFRTVEGRLSSTV